MSTSDFTRDELAVYGGAGIATLGSFLPWIEASIFGMSRTVTGTEGGDGWIVIVLAAIAAGIVLLRNSRKYSGYAVGVCGLLVTAVGLLYISDPTTGVEFDSATEEQMGQAMADPAMGLYIVFIGGVLILIGGGLRVTSDPVAPQQPYRQPPAQPQQPPQNRGQTPSQNRAPQPPENSRQTSERTAAQQPAQQGQQQQSAPADQRSAERSRRSGDRSE